jgi:hypothetical protein
LPGAESTKLDTSMPGADDRGSGTEADDRDTPGSARKTWSTPREGLVLFLRGATFSVAAPLALIVGTILSLVNQLHVVLDGDATWATWVRIAVNYAVPYCVASVGFLAASRRSES